MAHDVFVSFSSANKNYADEVVRRLEQRGIRCWYADRDIPSGADWAGSIIAAIRQCRILVLVFTDESNASQQVLREASNAVSQGKAIVAFSLTKSKPSSSLQYFLASSHWVDAWSMNIEKAFSQLEMKCEMILNGTLPVSASSGPSVRSFSDGSAKSVLRRTGRAVLGVILFFLMVVGFFMTVALGSAETVNERLDYFMGGIALIIPFLGFVFGPKLKRKFNMKSAVITPTTIAMGAMIALYLILLILIKIMGY